MRRGFLGCVLVLCWSGFAGGQDQNQSPSPTGSADQAPAATPAAAAPASPTADTVAKLRVYRQRRYVGSALAPSIKVDDKQVARVGNGRRVTIRLTPGAHSVASDDKSSAIALDAKSGQDYYVRIDEATGFWKGHGRLTLVMPEQGSAEYKLQKPIEPDRKFAKDMIEEDAEDAPQEKTK